MRDIGNRSYEPPVDLIAPQQETAATDTPFQLTWNRFLGIYASSQDGEDTVPGGLGELANPGSRGAT